jgi:hypothetical protein
VLFHFVYSAWARTCAAVLVLAGMSFVADDWLAMTSLTIVLILLLVTGILLLVMGVRDLIRDIRHMLHEGLHRNGHA